MAMGSRKLLPRNLTARAAYRVAGNPDITRPEDSVGNCYPGLDTDLRNLDRRFFPGLVFEFVARRDTDAPYTEPHRYGAWLSYIDNWGDPDLQPEYVRGLDEPDRKWVAPLAGPLLDALKGTVGETLSVGIWYIDWIEQHGKRISMNERLPDGSTRPLDGLFVWRLVRGIERGPVTIGLGRRDGDGQVVLNGWRRFFTDPHTGVISAAYQPGEIMQSLCSPWQHDFRDCTCHYWASNRPDVVHGEIDPGVPRLPGGRAVDAERAETLLDWMRAERSQPMAGATTNEMPLNRLDQMDYFQINRAWQELNVVIQNTEIGEVFFPPAAEAAARPFGSVEELATELRDVLAPLEMTLALEYIYARFSLRSPEEAAGPGWPTMSDDVIFARHYLMLTAASEMQHLRWVNEILWRLFDAKLVPDYRPVLVLSPTVPTGPGTRRPRALRRLEPATLDDFIAVERPSGTIDGAYARVAATFASDVYPQHLKDLASRIANDGMEHYSRLRDIRRVLQLYTGATPPHPYLRPVEPGTPEQAASALARYAEVVRNLTAGYADMAHGAFDAGGRSIAAARAAMNALLDEGERLAAAGIGIPFWPAS